MTVVNAEGRAQVERTGLGLAITIPARKNWFAIPFLLFWLIGWLFGEVTVTAELLANNPNTPDLFLVVWLLMWTMGGGFAIVALFWMLAGKHIITQLPGFLRVENKVFGWGTQKDYDISKIRNFRPLNLTKSSLFSFGWNMELWGFGKGHIAFDYGMKTIKIAPFIDEPEAQYIIEKFREVGLS